MEKQPKPPQQKKPASKKIMKYALMSPYLTY